MIYANIWQKRVYTYAYWLLGLLGLVIIFAGALEARAAEYATFGTCSQYITKSNGNLTLENNTNNDWHNCEANSSKNTGKWYWEITINDVGTLVTIGGGETGYLNNDVDFTGKYSYTYSYMSDGTWFYYWLSGGGAEAYGATYTNGDVIGVAIDLDNDTIEYFKNCSSQGSKSIQTGLNFIPMVSLQNASYPTAGNITANFGASAFSCSVPSGYNAGWYTEGGGTTTTSSTIDYNIDDFILVYKEKLLLIGGSLLMLGFCVMIIKVKQGVILPKKKI